ncbi:hypothetical protein, partial [Psychromonas marina]|uniref:hypothetical protein n=1 Tax=Psychromonas marina TaxID=88364 RepID=UPI0024E170A1
VFSVIKRINVQNEASNFVGYHADIRGLLTYWLAAPTLLISSWHLSSVYVRGSTIIDFVACITPSVVVPHPMLDSIR